MWQDIFFVAEVLGLSAHDSSQAVSSASSFLLQSGVDTQATTTSGITFNDKGTYNFCDLEPYGMGDLALKLMLQLHTQFSDEQPPLDKQRIVALLKDLIFEQGVTIFSDRLAYDPLLWLCSEPHDWMKQTGRPVLNLLRSASDNNPKHIINGT